MSLLLQITLFLAAALMIVPLAKRLGIATVLGYLFTGILLGPSVFNVVHDPEDIHKLAEYGVIFLMFIIGLELRPQRLWEMRKSIFVMGSLQVTLCGVLLACIVFFALQQQIAASIVIGFALALSSTAFVLQLLSEKQQLNTTFGLFLFSRYLMRPFFRFVAKSGAHELITAVGLFIVLGVVALMDVLGISTTLGAFLTGVLLADSEFRHELEASIAPFKGLLLGLFFMTVGMSTQVSLLWESPSLIIGGALLLMLVKLLALTAIARYFEFSWRNSLMLATCLAQGGEFAFVVLNVAMSEHVITQAILEPINLIVTLSMILTPILYWLMSSWVVPLFEKEATPVYDDIPEQHNPMIIAGFGRVGQIVARLVHLQHQTFTAIDSNIDKVDFVRNYGGKLYYGDATQPDILRAAGIEHAKVFVLAIDDIEDSMNVARHIRLNYPDLNLLVRARDRHHVHLLRDLGVEHIWRETYLSSLGMAYFALRNLGIAEQDAYKSIELFRDYDEKLLAQQQSIYNDEQKVYETHRNALAELEHLFESDTQLRQSPVGVDLQRELQHDRIDVTRDEVK
ncbi:hypothetical protein LTR94_014332 [Friedmanniomyces endolithicus]|nr:hypothetical protein LTR94_014332 [Friedmanniomyces endolithicus]